MAAAPCSRRNPLVRSGLTQDGRRRPELAPDHFLPDERDLADLILFGQRFARHVRFYPLPDGGVPGEGAARDWSLFFGGDVTARLAALAKLPVEGFRALNADLEAWLKADPERDPAELAAHAKLIFHLPVALAGEAARLHQGLPGGHPLAAQMAELARRELVAPLAALASWYKGAVDRGLFADAPLAAADYDLGPGGGRLRLSSTMAEALIGRPALSALTDADFPPAMLPGAPGGWAGLYAAAPADDTPYKDAQAPNLRYEQVYDALEYNLLVSAVERIYQGAARIRRDAAARLEESLNDFAGHLPHYGLWLAFLKLFRHAQAALNGFTARHLDFYYRDVLRLSGRAPEPDKVHLLFELARGRDAHLVPAGTMLRAGADALGAPVAYALENDIVVNRGRVAELRGLRVVDAPGGKSVRAAAVSASRDGLGEVPLAPEDPAWPAFGPDAAPAARIGFAVADRKLFLREGERVVSLRLALTRAVPAGAAPAWTVRLSGAKGWYSPSRVTTRIDNEFVDDPDEEEPANPRDGSKRRPKGRAYPMMEIEVRLRPDDPPVVPLDAKLHGSEHPPGLPCMEVAFDFAKAGGAAGFARLRDAEIAGTALQVSASGLRNLSVSNDEGPADPSAPFAPFGARPRDGASLILGSSEIFSKPLSELVFTLDWETPYDSDSFFFDWGPESYNPAASVLSGGRWLRRQSRKWERPVIGRIAQRRGARVDIGLGETGAEAEMVGTELIDGRAAQTLDNPPLTAASLTGFLKLTLPHGFGHAEYPAENARALIAYASEDVSYTPSSGVNSAGGMPLLPYLPMLTRLEARYTSRRETAATLRHLHPFGASARAGRRLFPDMPFEGALLIGVADFAAPARLTLLVQVADGSGDPLRAAPPLDVHYLEGDTWRAFEDRDVDDKTQNFASSGILGLNVPEAADTAHASLPPGLHWFRISAPADADALNRLLSVDAQAARAIFVDQGNDPAFLETPLPAGTISKLLVPDLAIKKVRQPYASFGGRPAEALEAFATRVSERIRHKDRGITAGDIEALVLEAFPKLHRVKCLTITELARGAGNRIVADNEAMPGAVTVVAVPSTQGSNARNPLRPYADQATLTAVADFLRPRLSPFVRLEVQNPKFEEIHADFKVRFRPEIADIAFYMDELNKALVSFLSPWERAEGGEIMFGGRLWKSALVDFVEERAEVDYVTDFRLFHKPDADAPAGAWTPVDVELIEATTARSVLVSAPRHNIREAPLHG
jgi:hypothetical protein